jgi:hypothetical protein
MIINNINHYLKFSYKDENTVHHYVRLLLGSCNNIVD